MSPEEELAQANALARMYPICIQGGGGATVNGKEYLWDYKNQTMVLKTIRIRNKNEVAMQTMASMGLPYWNEGKVTNKSMHAL